MKVIFKDTNEVRSVSLGYAVNYLLPKNLAVIATKAKLDALKAQKEEKAAVKSKGLEENRQLAEKLNGKVINFTGGATKKDIAEELKISVEQVVLPRSLKKPGEYQVVLKFGTLKAEVKVKVTAK